MIDHPSQMQTSPDLVMMTATELANAIHSRRVSCREVMTAHLDHIERVNPKVNAIVSLVERESLLEHADQADAELRAGTVRGWMHGMPHAVKDLAVTKGIRTTMGSPLFADWIPSEDAIFVERLRQSGAILIGKTNVPEWGLGSQSYNPVFGTTLNAYDQAKTAGGSSGGAAVALALRMVPVADGSDFAGSLRNPAGWNNVYGFRPSSGRVPNGPAPEVFLQQFGIDGPMARNVPDLAMLLSVMAGYDDRAPLSLADAPAVFAEPLKSDVAGTKIGWFGDLGGIPMEAGMLELCLSGLQRLEAAGCVIEEAKLDISHEQIWKAFVTLRQGLMAGRFASLYQDRAKRAQLKSEMIWEIENGLKLSAVDFYAASVVRTSAYQAFRKAFQSFDFLALPSAQIFPFAADLHWPAEVAGKAMDSYHRWMEVVSPASMAGLPVVAVPAGFGGPDGLPSGIQIIGPPRKDLAVLQLAYAYEQVSGEALSRLPPLLMR
jgi:amidase